MKRSVVAILVLLLCSANAWAGSIGEAVEVSIVTDDGRMLPTYPVKIRHGLKKVYAEAIRGDHYRIDVRNRLNRRVGLVIAVDGRNIISGAKSHLSSGERMYILEPYGSGQFSGWRSSQDRINRFYFTDVPDSYAAAFGDESAMGVIAVAVYPERQRYEPALSYSDRSKQERESKAETAAPAPEALGSVKKKAGRMQNSSDRAGTGYGRDEYSPVRIVAFDPESRAVETIFLKYEWRATLCKLGVAACTRPYRQPPNRFWDNDGYAPPPPVSYRR
jgi:hypothetical protein